MTSGIKLKIEEIIERFTNIHGDRYGYQLVDYINPKTKVKIMCKEHGIFEQWPQKHWNGGGCQECAKRVQADSNGIFIPKAIAVHNGKYLYTKTDYKNSKTKIIVVCPIHGDFNIRPDAHLKGAGCQKCSREQKTIDATYTNAEFIDRSINVYGNRWDYSQTNYIHSLEKVIIICKSHGAFEQTAMAHLDGHIGCYECQQAQSVFNHLHFYNVPDDDYIPMRLYCAAIANEDYSETFIKIGVTKQKYIRNRLNTLGDYGIFNILFIVSGTLRSMINLEQNMLKKFKEYQYISNNKFEGWTECLTFDALPLIKEYIGFNKHLEEVKSNLNGEWLTLDNEIIRLSGEYVHYYDENEEEHLSWQVIPKNQNEGPYSRHIPLNNLTKVE